MTAYRENARGVVGGVVAVPKHRLVTGALAFLEHLVAYPPHGGMKPKQCLHHAVQVGRQIVTARNVLTLVREHRAHLGIRQSPEQRGRQQHHRIENPRHGRFNVGIGDASIRRRARRRPRCPDY